MERAARRRHGQRELALGVTLPGVHERVRVGRELKRFEIEWPEVKRAIKAGRGCFGLLPGLRRRVVAEGVCARGREDLRMQLGVSVARAVVSYL
jgi:hypothetical protein